MKKKKLIYGLLLIVAAVLIILVSLDLPFGFIVSVPVVDIVLSLLIMILCINSMVRKHYWIAPIYLAVIFMLFEREIAEYFGLENGNIVSNWAVLLCAFLLAVGIKLITSSISNESAVTLSSRTKYINCDKFNKENIKVLFGSSEVYFENIESYKGEGVLDVECNMGSLKIHVPSSWSLVTDIETILGNIEVMPGDANSGPLVTIKGVCNKSNVKILRV